MINKIFLFNFAFILVFLTFLEVVSFQVVELMSTMPSWVQFPDTERVEWINKVGLTKYKIMLQNIHDCRSVKVHTTT